MSDPIDVIVTLTAALPVVAVDAQIYPYGNVTVSSGTGLAMVGQNLSLGTASGSTSGALTSTDWNTFSNKVTFPGYSATAPSAAGTANAGASANAARADHVHPAQTTITGNAATATALATARAINGVTFDGTSAITITAAALTLTGTTLNSGVVTSSLTSVGILTVGTWNATVIAGQYGGTGVANTGKTITLNNSNFAVSGTPSAIILASSGAGTVTYTMPTTSATMARTDAAQTFTGVQTFSSVPVFSLAPKVMAYQNAGQTIAASSWVKILFDTVEYDPTSCFNASTSTFTAPYAGYLRVTGAIYIVSGTAGSDSVGISIGGAAPVKRPFNHSNLPNNSGANFACTVKVAAGDSVTVVYYTSGGRVTSSGATVTFVSFDMLP